MNDTRWNGIQPDAPPPPHTHTQTQTQRETELEGKKTTPADACYVAG